MDFEVKLDLVVSFLKTLSTLHLEQGQRSYKKISRRRSAAKAEIEGQLWRAIAFRRQRIWT